MGECPFFTWLGNAEAHVDIRPSSLRFLKQFWGLMPRNGGAQLACRKAGHQSEKIEKPDRPRGRRFRGFFAGCAIVGVWHVDGSTRATLLSVTTTLIVASSAVGCTPAAPPRWAEGGAPLAFATARWDRESGGPVELGPDGRVLVDGELAFVIDRVGRVANADYDPYALVEPDGRLIGNGNLSLGRLGITNASPPGAVEAWLAVTPDGKVTYFDPDGTRTSGGVWHGCDGAVLRTCTLVTQLLAVANYRGAGPAIGIGVGVGVGVGVGF